MYLCLTGAVSGVRLSRNVAALTVNVWIERLTVNPMLPQLRQ